MTKMTKVDCDRWSVELPPDGADPLLEPDATPDGQTALKLTVHATAPIEVAERAQHAVVPGQAYCLTAQVRTALGNAHGRLFLQWLDAAGKAVGEEASKHTFLVHDYAPLQVWAVAPPGAFIEGTLVRVPRKDCRHVAHRLTFKVAGKTKTVYVPLDRVEEVEQWTMEYKRLKRLIKAVTRSSLGELRNHVRSRRAAASAGAGAGPRR